MKSPCISVCKIDPTTQICKGCGRTLEQVISWRSYTDEERERIMKNSGLQS